MIDASLTLVFQYQVNQAMGMLGAESTHHTLNPQEGTLATLDSNFKVIRLHEIVLELKYL